MKANETKTETKQGKRPKIGSYRDRGEFKITEFLNPSGETAYRVGGLKPDGTRVRENFKTHDEALGRKQQLETECANAANAGQMVFTKLTPEQVNDAERALRELEERLPSIAPNRELSLLFGIRYFLDNYREPVSRVTIPDALKKFTEAKKAEGCRRGTLRNFNRLTPFTVKFNAKLVSEITRADVLDFLKRDGVSPVTKDGDRRALSSFFSWCADEEQGYCADNPAINRGRKKKTMRSPKAISLLSLDDLRRLLLAAQSFKEGKLVPYVVLAVFCAIRPDELKRLSWADIDLEAEEIHISPEVSKIKSQRTVEIPASAVKWLLTHSPRKGTVVPGNWRKDFDSVKRIAGFGNPERRLKADETEEEKAAREALKPWPEDVMRHTGISYHVRQHGSEEKTATWAGNSVTIIRQRYKGKVGKADCKAFWSITPDLPDAKIVPHPALATA